MLPFLLALAALVASPATLPATVQAARPGDAITLAAGDYGAIAITHRTYDPPVTVDASAARLSSLTIRSVDGLEWAGGRLTAPREQAVGVTVDKSARVQVAYMTLTGPRTGITALRSTDLKLVGNRFDGIRSDGINLTQVERVDVVGNQCVNFRPIPAIYDAAGRLLKDGDHSDCIQGWTTPGTKPLADIRIVGNTADGPMQGIWFGNAGQGGYDRITIRDNDLRLGFFHGIAVTEGRDVTIVGNRVRAVPGARLPGGNRGPIRPWILMPDTTGIACGNEVAEHPAGLGTAACAPPARP